MNSPPRIAVILCGVLDLEIEAVARSADHVIHLEKLPQGLHEEPAKLRQELQQAVDRVEAIPEVEVISLGYGLCSRGTEDVRTRRCRLVLPRAHDCITLLLGSKERYAEYIARHPGTYWYSPGWIRDHIPPGQERYEKLLADYRERFGEDNAQYLMETEHHWFQTYERAAYVDLGVTDTAEDVAYTCRCAEWLGWQFDRQHGDIDLLRTLVCGPWDAERFLILEPGQAARMTGDDRIVERE